MQEVKKKTVTKKKQKNYLRLEKKMHLIGNNKKNPQKTSRDGNKSEQRNVYSFESNLV